MITLKPGQHLLRSRIARFQIIPQVAAFSYYLYSQLIFTHAGPPGDVDVSVFVIVRSFN